MSNEEVGEILRDAQKFWMRWRNDVPERDSSKWDEIVQDAQDIMRKNGKMVRQQEVNGELKEVEEYEAEGIILWFLDELERRCREKERIERGAV